MRKIKVGTVGLGRIGRGGHIPELSSLPDRYQFVALADNAPDRRTNLPESVKSVPVYSSLEEMLQVPELEMVTIGTRHPDHVPMALQIMEAGKIAVIEKPVAAGTAEMNLLRKALEKHPGKLFFRHNRRYEGAFRKIRDLIRSGLIGDVQYIKLYRSVGYCRRNDWMTMPEYYGGLLTNWGPHLIDQALQLLDSPVCDIWADVRRVISIGEGDDLFKILLKAANGCVADIEISSTCALPGNLYEVWGDRGALTVPNEGKVLRLKYLKEGFQLPEIHAETGNYPLFYGNQEPLELICEEIPVEAGRGHTLQKGARKESGVGTQATGYYSQDTMWLDVYDAIRNGITYPITMEDGVNVVKLTELIHRQNSLPIGG